MPRPVRVATAILIAWLVACELHGLGLHWVPTGGEKWLHLIAMGFGAALCLARAAIRRRERLAWTLLGLGVLAWTLGELYFTVVLWNDASPPVPSPADAGYLLLPPLVFAGVVVLARERIRGLPRTVWVDGVTAGLGVGAVSAALVFRPVLDSVSGASISTITNLCYPVADLTMLGLIGGLLAIGGRRADRRLGVIGVGALCFWIADTVYLIKVAHGTWVSGGPYDPGWWMIAATIAVAAWMRPPAPSTAHQWTPRQSIRTPIVFALVALGILIQGAFTHPTVPPIALAAGTVLSVIARLILTFRAHQEMLTYSRDEASTDPLTGLGNRRALSAALAERLDGAVPQPTVLAMFDLDGFKNYNDSFGHAAGDALLTRLAAALATVLPVGCGAFRMGGDEFCVLLPGDARGAALLLACGRVLTEHGDGFSITASAGSVTLPLETADPTEALRLADQRMYSSKAEGRRAGAAQEVKRTLLSALAQRDQELSAHLDDVGALAVATARELGCSAPLIERVGLAAELHDVGKVAIPEAVLDKSGPLEDGEWELMRQHTVAGERIISTSPALADVGPLVRSSHERWDGAGYPDGLAGEAIPLGSRIVAVCDSFHAMTTDRNYRKAMSEEVALAELSAGSGTQFDPAVVRVFLAMRARQGAVSPTRVR
jgi:two-component system cell cycle response regulator